MYAKKINLYGLTGIIRSAIISFNNLDATQYVVSNIIADKYTESFAVKGKRLITNMLRDKHKSVFYNTRFKIERTASIDLNLLTKEEIAGLEWSKTHYLVSVYWALIMYKDDRLPLFIREQLLNVLKTDYNPVLEIYEELGIYYKPTQEELDFVDKFRCENVEFELYIPIFVARQLIRHGVGTSITEKSQRYTDKDVEVWQPENWRKQSADKKQGSYENEFLYQKLIGDEIGYQDIVKMDLEWYKLNNENGACKEQTRAILPLATYTTIIWSQNLISFARMLALRLKSDAQLESRQVVKQMYDQVVTDCHELDKLIEIVSKFN